MIRLVLPTEDYEEQVLDYKASLKETVTAWMEPQDC